MSLTSAKLLIEKSIFIYVSRIIQKLIPSVLKLFIKAMVNRTSKNKQGKLTEKCGQLFTLVIYEVCSGEQINALFP